MYRSSATLYSGIQYKVTLPQGNPFPHGKHELVYEQMVRQGMVTAEDVSLNYPLIDHSILEAAHSPAYVEKVFGLDFTPAEARRIGLPLSEQLLSRAHASVSATYWAAQHAMQNGLGINLGGGTHHAFYDRAEAYCIFNDAAVCITSMLQSGAIHRPLVLDLDVHQGNGTASIFKGRPEVYTFSMHAAANYPLHKENSTRDIELASGTNDELYLGALQASLPGILAAHRPDFVFYIAGADVLATDRLGKLGLTPAGVSERDTIVFQAVRTLGCPLVVTLGGGYPGDLRSIVNVHTHTLQLALQNLA